MRSVAFAGIVASALLAVPVLARAHCDTLDGPVVKTARIALDNGRIGPVLAWVKKGDEAEVKAAFEKARAARKLGPAAKTVADTWFLETLVRIHRAGEGAPFTGLKPAGLDLGPAVPAADQAVDKGSVQEVEKLLVDTVHTGLHERFQRLHELKKPGDDVAAGRAWVEAYVPYVHYVEGVYQAAAGKHSAHAEPAETHAEAAPVPAEQGHRAH